MTKLDIIVPVKNEAHTVSALVHRIASSMRKVDIAYSIIFVDDRSTDDTSSVISTLAHYHPIKLHHKIGKPGKAFCILEGAEIATAEHVVMIDADLQYPPEIIPEMYKQASQHGVVVANRRVYKSTLLRRFASRANALVFGRLLFGLDCDIQSGLKLFRKEIIEHVDPSMVGPWSLDIPLLYAAKSLGYNIGSVDISFERRENGQSHISFLSVAFEIALGAMKLRLRRNHASPTFSHL